MKTYKKFPKYEYCQAITKKGNRCKRKAKGSIRLKTKTGHEVWCQFCDKHFVKVNKRS